MTVQMYCGDCLDVLPTLDADSVDAVVTDPPYGIGFEYTSGKDVTTTPAAYGEWVKRWYPEVIRIVRPGGLIAIWQAQLYFRHFWDWFGDDIRIYCAAKNFVQLRKTPINYGYDPVVMRYKSGASPLCPVKQHRSVDYFVANTAAVVSDMTRIEKAHPCPRPLDQTAEIVRNFTLPGGTVLDPFMGSGTTGVACVQEDRSFIGIEREQTYYAIAERRIATAQPPLFSAAD